MEVELSAFSLQIENDNGSKFDIHKFRYERDALCLSEFCCGSGPVLKSGKLKTPGRGMVDCPDCHHALVWRTRKIRRGEPGG